MCYDVKMIENLVEGHDYVVQEGKIGYKYFDSIDFNTYYRYQTMFLYYSKYGENNENSIISEKKLKDVLGISIKCGNYSYA